MDKKRTLENHAQAMVSKTEQFQCLLHSKPLGRRRTRMTTLDLEQNKRQFSYELTGLQALRAASLA